MLIPTYKNISFLGARLVSTSLFKRRSINGLSRRWIFLITFDCYSSISYFDWELSTWKSSSNSYELSNSFGIKKFSSAQSSVRLFCSGVPVSSSLCWARNFRSTYDKTDWSFLIRWASSSIKISKGIFESSLFSFIVISKVVSTTSYYCFFS